MICKVNGDLTGRLVKHDDYDHSYETQQFSPGSLKHIQSLDLQNTPLFFLAVQLTCRQIQIVVWVQQRNGCHTSLALSFSRASRWYCSTSTTGLIPNMHRLGQVFNLPNFNNIWFPHSSPIRWLPDLRWLYTAHSEPSLWCIPCLFPPDNHSIIRLPQIH